MRASYLCVCVCGGSNSQICGGAEKRVGKGCVFSCDLYDGGEGRRRLSERDRGCGPSGA